MLALVYMIFRGSQAADSALAEKIISSEDSFVQATIGAGAVEEGSVCTLKPSRAHLEELPQSLEPVVGPYALRCESDDGSLIDEFSAAAGLTFKLTQEHVQRYQNLTVYQYNQEKWQAVGSANYDQALRRLSFAQFGSGEVVLLGQSGGISPSVIALVLLALGSIALVFVILLRRAQQQDYRDYLRRKYYNL